MTPDTPQPTADCALRTVGLGRRFGRRPAVVDLSLEVPRGQVTCFLGPNGAGKSTTIRMMLGLIRPSSGHVEMLGRRIRGAGDRVLQRVGFVVENPAFYDDLTGLKNLVYFARSFTRVDRDELGRLIDLAGLTGREGDRVRTYSQGMKQRLALAQALVGGPELVILDEPTNGLDPQGIREFRSIIRRLATERGITVFLSSHLLAEVEQVADNLGIIESGRLVYQGPMAGLPRSQELEIVVDRPDEARAMLEQDGLVERVRPGADTLLVVDPGECDPAELNHRLVQAGYRVTRLAPVRQTLEDIFLGLTGSGGGDA